MWLCPEVFSCLVINRRTSWCLTHLKVKALEVGARGCHCQELPGARSEPTPRRTARLGPGPVTRAARSPGSLPTEGSVVVILSFNLNVKPGTTVQIPGSREKRRTPQWVCVLSTESQDQRFLNAEILNRPSCGAARAGRAHGERAASCVSGGRRGPRAPRGPGAARRAALGARSAGPGSAARPPLRGGPLARPRASTCQGPAAGRPR